MDLLTAARLPKRRSRRCVYCSSTCVERGIFTTHRWYCLCCYRLQPDRQYPPPRMKK